MRMTRHDYDVLEVAKRDGFYTAAHCFPGQAHRLITLGAVEAHEGGALTITAKGLRDLERVRRVGTCSTAPKGYKLLPVKLRPEQYARYGIPAHVWRILIKEVGRDHVE